MERQNFIRSLSRGNVPDAPGGFNRQTIASTVSGVCSPWRFFVATKHFTPEVLAKRQRRRSSALHNNQNTESFGGSSSRETDAEGIFAITSPVKCFVADVAEGRFRAAV
jgi:hypothetical protein